MISFRQQIDPVGLGVAQCVPVGLILNEAVTNAIKHAFPGLTKEQYPSAGTGPRPLQRPGDAAPEILVMLKLIPNDHLELAIADNGQGLPPGNMIVPNGSMGMELMQILSEQLGGTLTLDSHQGLVVKIKFPMEGGLKSITSQQYVAAL